LKRIRQLHLYLGTFLAPTVIFFAFSGAFQIFRLQESRPGSSYQPPAWIEKLAGVHKDQRWPGQPKPRPAAPPPGESPAPPPAPRPEGAPEGQPPAKKPSVALKWFFLLTSIGVIVSTVFGIVMAFKTKTDRRLIWGLLVAGTVLPIVLLFL
jgi:hypothetical protein